MLKIWLPFPIETDPEKLRDEVAGHARENGGTLEELYFHGTKKEAYALVRADGGRDAAAIAAAIRGKLNGREPDVLLTVDEKKAAGPG